MGPEDKTYLFDRLGPDRLAVMAKTSCFGESAPASVPFRADSCRLYATTGEFLQVPDSVQDVETATIQPISLPHRGDASDPVPIADPLHRTGGSGRISTPTTRQRPGRRAIRGASVLHRRGSAPDAELSDGGGPVVPPGAAGGVITAVA